MLNSNPEQQTLIPEQLELSTIKRSQYNQQIHTKLVQPLVNYMNEQARTNEFYASITKYYRTKGFLSTNQFNIVSHNYEVHCQSPEQRDELAHASKLPPTAMDDISWQSILDKFSVALANGLLKPKLFLEGYKFNLAPATGTNAGYIYVTFKGTYIGKLSPIGQFHAIDSTVSKTHLPKLRKLCANLDKSIKAHGIATGQCSCCGRLLTNKASIAAGIGPICSDKWGM